MTTNIVSEGLMTANIVVAGKTGVGKSTLINAVFGKELAETGIGSRITEDIKLYKNQSIPICVYDTAGLELDPIITNRTFEKIKNLIASKSNSRDQSDMIHAIWYCINSASNRYEEAELEFIKKLYDLGGSIYYYSNTM